LTGGLDLVYVGDMTHICLCLTALVAITSVPSIHSSASQSTIVRKTTFIFCLVKDWNSRC